VHDTLLLQLYGVDGCDEWAVHMYADRAVIREQISTESSAIRRLRDEHAAARPGRAYFLEQQLRDELERATEHVLSTFAQSAFSQLAHYAVAAQVSSVPDADLVSEVEILRASFLIARDSAEQFKEDLCSGANSNEWLRCDYSGPWPPYSFAVRDDEEPQ
jgi:hypothetical protein